MTPARTRALALLATTVAPLLAHPGWASSTPPAEPPGAETPQAVVARASAAAENADFAELAACMAPADRGEMAVGLLMASSMMVAFLDVGNEMASGMAEAMGAEGAEGAEVDPAPDADQQAMAAKAEALRQRHQKIMAEHGLTDRLEAGPGFEAAEDPAAAAAKLLEGVDTIALIGDLTGLLGELGESGWDEESGGPLRPGVEITDYAIDGDSATARGGDEVIEFVRVDGRWYLRAPADEE